MYPGIKYPASTATDEMIIPYLKSSTTKIKMAATQFTKAPIIKGLNLYKGIAFTNKRML